MTRRQKRMLGRILAAAGLLAVLSFVPAEGVVRLLLHLIPYLTVGWDILWKAVRGLFRGQLLDENFLMAIATVGALVLGEYTEAVGVMLFYQVGELFQRCAVGKSRRSIANLMEIRPDSANVERGGQLISLSPDEVAVGETILVRPGEKIPLDGMVVEGISTVDTAALTGESLPRETGEGEDILSGCVNLTGTLRIRVTKEFGQSTVAKILDLVEDAAAKKARTEAFITRFARVYTPAVVAGAALLAVIPSLITGNWGEWIHRALIFLVISCPCALVISIPLSFFGGIGGASARGILVKGGSYLELLARTETVVFDKTGTLTRGEFSLTALYPAPGMSEAELLETVTLAECHSPHPIAKSLRAAYGGDIDPARVSGVREMPGFGVSAVVDGSEVLAGSGRLMDEHGIAHSAEEETGTVIHAAKNGCYLGYAVISDTVKPSAPEAIRQLKKRSVRTVMLTGDNEEAGRAVAARLGLDEVHARLLPQDKVERLEELLAKKHPKKALVYVGDGINDAPVLSRADVGIAMGALGSDAAIEAADVVLMDDDPAKLAEAIVLARKCVSIVWQNILFALGVKGLCLLLGALGLASMWAAVFADVGVAVIAILNAMRMLRVSKK